MSPEKLIAIPGRLIKVERGRAALHRVTDPRHTTRWAGSDCLRLRHT